jgi:hypothetical protein
MISAMVALSYDAGMHIRRTGLSGIGLDCLAAATEGADEDILLGDPTKGGRRLNGEVAAVANDCKAGSVTPFYKRVG